MSKSAFRAGVFAGGALALGFTFGGQVAAQTGYMPNLQSDSGGWTHPFGSEFPPVPGSALPVRQDPAHPFIDPMRSFRIGDLSNPNLREWARDVMKKDNDEVIAGKIAFTANSSCLPAGVPMFYLGVGPFYIVQTPKEVVMLEEGGQQVRHIYMNVPHSAKVKPSWYGESVGRYEGDSLVVDTIGITRKTVVDPYRTPHTDKLHVTERWHLIDNGYTLEVNITVDDPDTYVQPWQSFQRYQRSQRTLAEFICAENNTNLFDYHMPTAVKSDF